MREQIVPVLLALIIALGNVATAEDADADLTADEKAEMVTLLDDSLDMFMGLISGLTDEQWNFRENEDRWSVGQCAEHIVRSERALFESAESAMKNAADADWAKKTKGKADLIRNVMPNRNPGGAGGASAPQEIRPTEEWSRAKVIQEYYKVRGEVRAFAETVAFEQPIKQHIFEHPFPVFGDLSAYEWLIYVPLHTVRHSKQMIEVMEDEAYPKGE
jgi:hypothetical protein